MDKKLLINGGYQLLTNQDHLQCKTACLLVPVFFARELAEIAGLQGWNFRDDNDGLH